jgi:hypothetical protein
MSAAALAPVIAKKPTLAIVRAALIASLGKIGIVSYDIYDAVQWLQLQEIMPPGADDALADLKELCPFAYHKSRDEIVIGVVRNGEVCVITYSEQKVQVEEITKEAAATYSGLFHLPFQVGEFVLHAYPYHPGEKSESISHLNSREEALALTAHLNELNKNLEEDGY